MKYTAEGMLPTPQIYLQEFLDSDIYTHANLVDGPVSLIAPISLNYSCNPHPSAHKYLNINTHTVISCSWRPAGDYSLI